LKILFLTQVLPWPLDAGPKVRACHVLRYLAQSHQISLVSYVRETDGPDAPDYLRRLCRSVHVVPMHRSRLTDAGFLASSLLRRQSFILARDKRASMGRTLEQVVRTEGPFDVVHADQLWMAAYGLHAAHSLHARFWPAAPRPLTVLDQHNACYRIFARLAEGERNRIKRLLLAREARLMACEEAAACAAHDQVVWVTREDADAVATVARGLHLRLPNGNTVIPICSDPTTEPALPRTVAACRVTFLGGLHYPPNAEGILWFAREVFPRVLAHVPDALLTVIGKSPPAALYGAGIPSANLHVTGYLEDPRPLLSETAAFIVPLLAGGGMRVKIIEGWTWALPIVSTRVGAEGIDLGGGEPIWLADTAQEFAAAVVRLLQNPPEGDKLASAGRAWVEQRYGWRSVYQAWDAVYASAGVGDHAFQPGADILHAAGGQTRMVLPANAGEGS